jgi:polyketide biosynthesis acyl carrier protein
MMTKQELIELIGNKTREVIHGLANHEFGATDRLVDLGANSVDRAEIVTLVQEALLLKIPRIELFGPTNIGELADVFLKKLNAP